MFPGMFKYISASARTEKCGPPGRGVSGAGLPAKPVRKKRNFKEDEYDRDDDFVDDAKLMWEEHAAASKDGFFIYWGPTPYPGGGEAGCREPEAR